MSQEQKVGLTSAEVHNVGTKIIDLVKDSGATPNQFVDLLLNLSSTVLGASAGVPVTLVGFSSTTGEVVVLNKHTQNAETNALMVQGLQNAVKEHAEVSDDVPNKLDS